jgi:hypothetical protein
MSQIVGSMQEMRGGEQDLVWKRVWKMMEDNVRKDYKEAIGVYNHVDWIYLAEYT